MLYRESEDSRGRVLLADSVPAMLLGALAGGLVGLLVSAVCRRWPPVVASATLLVTTLLGAAIVAPAGWIAGDLRVGIERDAPEGMAQGALFGAVGGFLVGVAQLLSDKKRRRAEQIARTQSPQSW
jgi:hypothetical protein